MKYDEIRFFSTLGSGDNEYTINGVKYIVSARFLPFSVKKPEKTISEKLEKYIGSDFAHLTNID